MSIFTRPESPPPRQPSPELDYAPLHVRGRHTSSSPDTPPGLYRPKPRKSILTVRSLNDLPSQSSSITPPATPRSLRADLTLNHRRTLSNAIPYLSPPPSPTIPSPPPPVPPIPSFALSPPTPIKNCPRPAAITPIHLPDLDSVPPLPEATTRPKPPSPPKHQKVAMTCLRFFSLRNSKRRPSVPPSVA